MNTHNQFKVLNTIINAYSNLSITAASIDNFVTLQIIGGCMLDVQQLRLTKAQVKVLAKMTVNNKRKGIKYQKQCKQISDYSRINKISQSYSTAQQQKSSINTSQITQCLTKNNHKFTVILIHEHFPTQSLSSYQLLSSLLLNIEPLIIMDSNMSIFNNILHFQKSKLFNQNKNCNENRVFAVFVPASYDDTKDWQYFQQELHKFCDICDIYQGHINLRLCLYLQSNNNIIMSLTTIDKLQYFVHTIRSHINSEDELQVLVRPQIPKNAFIHLVSQCAYRTGFVQIKQTSQYILLNEHENLYYSFIVNNSTSQSFPSPPTMDQLMIWVLHNGQPVLQLLPTVSKCLSKGELIKKYNYRSRGQGKVKRYKYQQIRSILGYTHVIMEHKLDQNTHQAIIKQKPNTKNEQNVNNDDNQSMYCQESQNSLNLQCSQSQNFSDTNSNQQKNQPQQQQQPQPLTCIINITATDISFQQRNQIIQSEIRHIFHYFQKMRKDMHQNIQVERQLKLIKRASQILGVLQDDVWKIVITDKL